MTTLLLTAAAILAVDDYAYVAPSYLRASIWVSNGSTRCSGGTFLKGPKYAFGLSAAHCFQGRIGGEFTVGNIYGDTGPATLLAIDRDRDLALFRFDSDMAHGVVCVPGSILKTSRFRKLGYTGGRGPKRGEVKFRNRMGRGIWFDVLGGKFGHGDSGGYVYAIDEVDETRGYLVAVVHGGNGDLGNGEGHELFGPGLREIHTFLSWHEKEFDGHGPFNTVSEYG